MNFITIALSGATMLAMAIVLSFILGWANRAFYVETDPRVERVIDALPGANCGGCGYVGCGEYAEAVAQGGEEVSLCTVGGAACAQTIAGIMGVEVSRHYPYRPIVHCGATFDDRLGRSNYKGIRSCGPANLVTDVQGCVYGCLGFGDCTKACEYDALSIKNGLATVDYEKCVGCGACSKVCPRNIISMAPFKASQMMAVLCSNLDSGKDVKAVCKVGCLGCKACTRISGLFKVENNLSTIDYDEYSPDRLEDVIAASKKCPRNRLVFIGIPEPKDLEATEDEDMPKVVKSDFKTTVDDTEWRG